MTSSSFYAFLFAITLLTITPGVDTVLVIRNSSRAGFRDGALTTLGICSGLFVHATVSAIGISIILLQSAWMFSTLKLLGASYLIWLGIMSFKSALRRHPLVAAESVATQSFSPWRSLREGFLSNVLNPKAIVFYMAFLPLFIDPAGSALGQSLFLASIHFLISTVWLCLVAAMVDQMKSILSRGKVKQLMDWLVGSTMIGFGLALAGEAYQRR